MRVLLLSPLPPPAGGIATWTENYCRYIDMTDHSVTLVNTALVGKRAEGEQRKRLTDELFRALRIVKQMRSALCREEIDCLHINTSCSFAGLLRDGFCMMLAGKRPVILHCHCDIDNQVGKGKGKRKLMSLVAKKATVTLALNEKSRDYLHSLGCENVRILPNFIAEDSVAPPRIIREQIETILYVGHVRRTKGLFELLEAAVALPEINFRLLGPAYEDLSGIQIPDNVELVGLKPREAVGAYLQAADVFLFPSYSEGFSIALLEAMAAGLPCIATDVGANKDMLEDQGGILIPVGDGKAIVDAVNKLQDAAVRGQMSAWNQKKVRESYTVDRVMARLLNIMGECVL